MTKRTSNPRGKKRMAVASVCVRGIAALWHNDEGRAQQDTSDRIAWLPQLVDRILARGHALDALVLPGGFFFLPRFIGDLPFARRKSALAKSAFSRACSRAARSLGCPIVAGVDTTEGTHQRVTEGADQLCVAWGETGVVGIGRKVFPTSQESHSLVVTASDYGDAGRVLDLPSGRRALLCACYDGFGVASPERYLYVRFLRVGGKILMQADADAESHMDAGLRAWRALCQQVDTALIAIHGFQGKGRPSMWQRHGVAGASAALRGGLAIGAAHFDAPLPSAPDRSTLAASCVPASHLGAGRQREAHALIPIDHEYFEDALIRWYLA